MLEEEEVMRPTDKIILRIQEAYTKNKGVRLSAEDVNVLAEGVFCEGIFISEDGPFDSSTNKEVAQ